MSTDADPEWTFLYHVSSYSTLVVVATVLVALRIFVKLKIVRSIGPEDFALVFSLVVFFLCSSNTRDFSDSLCVMLTGNI